MASMHSDPFRISVDNQFEFDITPEMANNLDIVPDENNVFHLIHNGQSYKAFIEEVDYATRSFVINVKGQRHQVSIADKYIRLIEKMGLNLGSDSKENNIIAPMPGLVLDVLVKEGQEVKEGEVLVILEAMKMENVLKAAQNGKVKSVLAGVGKAVEKGTVLIEME